MATVGLCITNRITGVRDGNYETKWNSIRVNGIVTERTKHYSN